MAVGVFSLRKYWRVPLTRLEGVIDPWGQSSTGTRKPFSLHFSRYKSQKTVPWRINIIKEMRAH